MYLLWIDAERMAQREPFSENWERGVIIIPVVTWEYLWTMDSGKSMCYDSVNSVSININQKTQYLFIFTLIGNVVEVEMVYNDYVLELGEKL